ncbi:hypothetical protein Pelsub_P0925 [Pelolinea submarina]|nr:hypothetical protein Pelsub_P0925 [Pelolinea submarina]
MVEWHNYIGANILQYPSIEFVIMYLDCAVLIQTNIPVKKYRFRNPGVNECQLMLN